MELDDLKAAVDAELTAFLSERREAVPEAADMIGEIGRLLRSGGKRLRPAFCYWGFRAAGGRHCVEIVRAAASLELLHTFAIVHDDVMDASDERRGAPTVHVRRGLNVAILVGDLALVLADAALVGAGFAPATMTAAFGAYSRMRQQVIAGQFLELTQAARADVGEDVARRIAVLKSGRYSVQEPLLIGASLAGAAPGLLDGLVRFGGPLGEAFQLRDDLLGSFGRRGETGKPVDSDIREGKRNVLYAKTIAALAEPERSFFTARWGGGDDLTHADVDRLRSLVESSGARAATEELLASLAGEAHAALVELDLPDDAFAALSELARVVVERQA